jgi:hypothetical protein
MIETIIDGSTGVETKSVSDLKKAYDDINDQYTAKEREILAKEAEIQKEISGEGTDASISAVAAK